MKLASWISSPKIRAALKVIVLVLIGPTLIYANPDVEIGDLFCSFEALNHKDSWINLLEGFQKVAFVAAGLVVSGFQLRVRIIDLLQKDYFTMSEFSHLEVIATGCTRRISSIMVWLVGTATVMAVAPLAAQCFPLGFVIAWICMWGFSWGILDFLAILMSFDELEDFTLRSIHRHKKRIETEKAIRDMVDD